MSKMRVAVLRGGPSEEFDVSLRSGERVLEALRRLEFDARDIVITRTGEWLHHGRERDPHEVLHGVDAVFIALHGAYGEDGTVQRLLERFGVPYTGSGSYSSTIAMHKAIAKDHLRDEDIAMPRHFIVSSDSTGMLDRVSSSIGQLFGPRYMVKPVAGGSSIGATRADNIHMLLLALTETLKTYSDVIVEEFIEGREVTCGIIESFRGQALYALPAVEIVPGQRSFFDYEAKYDGKTTEICPSSFPNDTKMRIEFIARTAHERLGLSQYSRSDMIVGNDGHVYYLETNTLPGLTAESLFPKALDAIGASYDSFIAHLLTHATERQRR